MFRLSFRLAVVMLVACASATAGEIPLYRGQSNRYAIEFPDPTNLPNSMIEISAYVEGDLAYTKKLKPVSFKPECRLTTSEISCSKNGKSPLAGATALVTVRLSVPAKPKIALPASADVALRSPATSPLVDQSARRADL